MPPTCETREARVCAVGCGTNAQTRASYQACGGAARLAGPWIPALPRPAALAAAWCVPPKQPHLEVESHGALVLTALGGQVGRLAQLAARLVVRRDALQIGRRQRRRGHQLCKHVHEAGRLRGARPTHARRRVGRAPISKRAGGAGRGGGKGLLNRQQLRPPAFFPTQPHPFPRAPAAATRQPRSLHLGNVESLVHVPRQQEKLDGS